MNFICLAMQAVVASKMYESVDVAGKRLWQCAECDYARNKKDHVTKHVEQKHSGLQFQCEFCQAVFHRRDTYRDHIKKKHSIWTHARRGQTWLWCLTLEFLDVSEFLRRLRASSDTSVLWT